MTYTQSQALIDSYADDQLAGETPERLSPRDLGTFGLLDTSAGSAAVAHLEGIFAEEYY